MFDLTKFTPTRRVEFEQLARDRKEDFDMNDWLFNANDGVMTWLNI